MRAMRGGCELRALRETTMLSFYLDNMMYDYLLDEAPDCRSRLRAAIEARKCRMFGSAQLLEELAGVREAKRRRALVALFWSLVEQNVLDYAFRLIEREVAKDTVLPAIEACLPRDVITELQAMSPDDPRYSSGVGQDVRHQKEQYKNWRDKAAADFERMATDLHASRRLLQDAMIDEELQNEFFREWRPHDAGRLSSDPLSRLPCLRASVAIAIACIYRTHAWQNELGKTGKKTKSELYDSNHYVSAGAVGVTLVTNDVPFRNAIKRITWRPVPVVDAGGFCSQIAVLEQDHPSA